MAAKDRWPQLAELPHLAPTPKAPPDPVPVRRLCPSSMTVGGWPYSTS